MAIYLLPLGTLLSLYIVFSAPNEIDFFSYRHISVLGGFLLIMLVSIALSSNFSHSLFTSAPFLPASLVFLLIVICFRSEQDILDLYFALSILALGISLLLLLEGMDTGMRPTRVWVQRTATPLIVVPNDAILLAIIAPLSLSVILKKPRSYRALIVGLSIVLSIVVIVFLKSRGAALVMLVTLPIVLNAHFRLKHTIIIAVSALMFILLIDGATGFNLLGKFSNIREARFSLWVSAWTMFLDHPWFGYGPHTFVFHYQQYLPVGSGLAIESKVTPWAHSLYFELLAEQGIFVTLSFLGLMLYYIGTVRSVIVQSNNEARMLGVSTRAALVGFMLAAVFELSFIRIWVVLLMFIMLAVVHNLALMISEQNNDWPN